MNINCKVLSALPPNAKENDVVVISSAASNTIVVDSDTPASMPTNGAYVEYGGHQSGKPTITLIDEQPEFKLTLHAAFQKTASAMEPREAYVYSGGKFVKFSSRSLPATSLPDPVSTKVLIRDKNTKIYGAPIIWRLADKNHYSFDHNYPQNAITLISDCVLTFRPFDANEPTSNIIRRYSQGNNRYAVSNIHQWLNSDAGPGKWFTKAHQYDEAPTADKLNRGVNPYADEEGFLYGFSANFKSHMLETAFGVVKHPADGNGSETVKAKIAIPSKQEVGDEPENLSVSAALAIFNGKDSSERIAAPTPESITHSDIEPREKMGNGTFYTGVTWYLRTPAVKSQYDNYLYSVSNTGYCSTITNAYPNGGTDNKAIAYGIRPICNLPNTVQLLKAADGIYDIVW